MTFEVWLTDGSGRASRKLATTTHWGLANFFARVASLAGAALVLGDAVFDGQVPPLRIPNSALASYRFGHGGAFAGSPGVPSLWP